MDRGAVVQRPISQETTKVMKKRITAVTHIVVKNMLFHCPERDNEGLRKFIMSL